MRYYLELVDGIHRAVVHRRLHKETVLAFLLWDLRDLAHHDCMEQSGQ